MIITKYQPVFTGRGKGQRLKGLNCSFKTIKTTNESRRRGKDALLSRKDSLRTQIELCNKEEIYQLEMKG